MVRETTLIDDFRACLSKPSLMVPFDRHKRNGKALARLKGLVKRAECFLMEDSMTTLAAETSVLSPDVLSKLFTYRRCPFDVMWIEWNEGPRIDVLSKTGIASYTDRGTPRKVGMLIENDTMYEDDVYRVSIVFGIPQGHTLGGEYPFLVSPIGFAYSAEVVDWSAGRPYNENDNKLHVICQQAITKKFNAPRMPDGTPLSPTKGVQSWLMGPGYLQLWLSEEPHINNQHVMDMFNGIGRTNIVSTSFSGECFLDYIHRDDGQDEMAIEGTIKVLGEIAGDLRWVLTVMGLLNSYQVMATEPMKMGPGKHIVKGKSVPYMEYRRVSLKVPGKVPVNTVRKDFHHTGTPRRAHMVRGHRRLYKSGKEVWVQPHQRGDAGLGWVIKDYVVEAADDV